MLPIIGKIIQLCDIAGWETIETHHAVDGALWTTLEAISDAITGVYYCLSSSKGAIFPQKNLPKAYQRGWDYALWYCFSSAAKVNEHNDGFTIERCVNLLPPDKGTWGGKMGKFADYDRIATLLRMLSQHMKVNIGPVYPFLKSRGYFVNKLVGKKPVKGLYLQEELEHLVSEWASRSVEVEENFNKLPKQFKDIPPGMTLTKYLSRLAVPLSKEAKIIEDAKSKRISDLLVVEGRGRSTRRVIAKGSDLPEKLVSINGGDSVRTIAKVLYSPYCCATTQSAFISATMAETKSLNLRDDRSYLEYLQDLASKGKASPSQEDILLDRVGIQLASQTYLEILPDRVGSISWDSAFGVYTKIK